MIICMYFLTNMFKNAVESNKFLLQEYYIHYTTIYNVATNS